MLLFYENIFIERDIKQWYFKRNVDKGESTDFYTPQVVVQAQCRKLFYYNHCYTLMSLLVLHTIDLRNIF